MTMDPSATVTALAQRLGGGDSAAWGNLAWFAARRGEDALALVALRRAVGLPGVTGSMRRALEDLARGDVRTMLLWSADRLGHPADSGNTVAAGLAAHRRNEVSLAEACYRSAMDQPRSHDLAANALAVLHEQREETDAADELWRDLLGRGDWVARHNAAVAMLRRGAPQRARLLLHDDGGKAVSAPLSHLAGYAALLDHDPEAACRLLLAAVAADPELARGQFALALAAAQLHRADAAVRAIRKALLLSPRFVPAVWILHSAPGEPLFEFSADSAEPDSALTDLLVHLGRTLLHAGHCSEALAVFDQLLTQQPAQPVARFHRGVVLAKLRRYGEALDDWEVVGHDHAAPDLAIASQRHARSARHLASLFAPQ
jgi:tetratricopeptide (TPR) repeat protein